MQAHMHHSPTMIKKKPNKVIELRAAATEALQGTASYAGRVMAVYRLIE